MNTDPVRIAGIGLVCAAGTGLGAAHGALISGDFMISRHPGWFNRDYERQVCSWIKAPGPACALAPRLTALAGAAQDDLLRMTASPDAQADRVALLLPGPEDAAADDAALAHAAQQIAAQLRFGPGAATLHPGGSAHLAVVIAALLADPGWQSAVVIAADCLLPYTRLAALDRAQRLFSDRNPWGSIPSEAGVAIWLRRGAPAFLPALPAAAWAQEPVGPDDHAPPLFRGMSDALNGGLDALGPQARVDDIWGDCGNGRYHASEQAHAVIRAGTALAAGAPLVNPCRALGDCGAAGMAVALALSLGDPAAGPVTAVLGTDNRAGPRGALIVARPPR